MRAGTRCLFEKEKGGFLASEVETSSVQTARSTLGAACMIRRSSSGRDLRPWLWDEGLRRKEDCEAGTNGRLLSCNSLLFEF